MVIIRVGAVSAVCALLLLSPLPALCETVALNATLRAASEVPPNDGAGRGEAHLRYNTDTRQLEYALTYDQLSGQAVLVDIHGPAAPGSNADAVTAFPVPDSPLSGTKTLTDDQAVSLLAGQLYVDVHTDSHPNGEIRGQIQK